MTSVNTSLSNNTGFSWQGFDSSTPLASSATGYASGSERGDPISTSSPLAAGAAASLIREKTTVDLESLNILSIRIFDYLQDKGIRGLAPVSKKVQAAGREYFSQVRLPALYHDLNGTICWLGSCVLGEKVRFEKLLPTLTSPAERASALREYSLFNEINESLRLCYKNLCKEKEARPGDYSYFASHYPLFIDQIARCLTKIDESYLTTLEEHYVSVGYEELRGISSLIQEGLFHWVRALKQNATNDAEGFLRTFTFLMSSLVAEKKYGIASWFVENIPISHSPPHFSQLELALSDSDLLLKQDTRKTLLAMLLVFAKTMEEAGEYLRVISLASKLRCEGEEFYKDSCIMLLYLTALCLDKPERREKCLQSLYNFSMKHPEILGNLFMAASVYANQENQAVGDNVRDPLLWFRALPCGNLAAYLAAYFVRQKGEGFYNLLEKQNTLESFSVPNFANSIHRLPPAGMEESRGAEERDLLISPSGEHGIAMTDDLPQAQAAADRYLQNRQRERRDAAARTAMKIAKVLFALGFILFLAVYAPEMRELFFNSSFRHPPLRDSTKPLPILA